MIGKEKTIQYAHHDRHPGKFVSLSDVDQVVELEADNQCVLRIEVLSPKIIRFRYSVRWHFLSDFSYAIDPKFTKSKVDYLIFEDDVKIEIKTSLLEVHILKEGLSVLIYNQEGDLLNSDEKGFHWEEDERYGGEIVKMTKSAIDGEAFFGLGDKTSSQNIRGRRYTNWGSDEFGYTGASDPLYKNINLYYGFHDGLSYGIFFDNSFRTHYDLGLERSDVLSFWAEGGEMNYYFFYGEDLLDVSSQYANLTGVPELPPLWSLGYQQCKWSYFPESRVKEVAAKLRSERLPCDAIYLDIDYMDGFRCFTWDSERFPDPKKLVADLKNEGFQVVSIIDPGIKIDIDYEVFKEGLEKDYFCKRADGPYMQGKVWPGECYFPDFTRPEVRDWWAGLFEDLVGNVGLAGIWTDMNEPAVFEVPSKTFPPDVRHDYDGHPSSHRRAHNVYGMQMARATSDGVKRFNSGKRPLVITRSGYAGMQRYTSTWTGDNLANWDHLYYAHMQTLRLSISGVSFCGSDIGGFIDHPSAELFVRWFQLGVFHPFFRSHSSGDHGDQEPWLFGKRASEEIRKAIELRYQLLPYIYTCFYEHTRTGKPMLRPMIFQNCGKKPYLTNNNESAFLGEHILYSPVLLEGMKEKTIFLPEGAWYDFGSSERYNGNRTHSIPTPLSKIPMFVKEGAVIPLYPVMQYVNERRIETVTLNVYFSKNKAESRFYCDDGDGYSYTQGNYREAVFNTQGGQSHFFLGQSYEGDFEPDFQDYRIRLVGLSAIELSVKVDGLPVDDFQINSSNIVVIMVNRNFKTLAIEF